MFKLYYCSFIDVNPKEAFKQIENFKKILSKYNNLDVYGAGWKNSPIITPQSSIEYKSAITAYDLRVIRSCDILLTIIDLKTFCPGTCIEMEYGRQLGLYIIVCILGKEKLKNIFIEFYASKIVYGIENLKKLLEKLNNEI